MEKLTDKFLGYGHGLYGAHMEQIQEQGSPAQWFEVTSENYMGVPGLGHGFALSRLEEIRESFPITLQCQTISLGNAETLDKEYIKHLKTLINIIKPKWVSGFLGWTAYKAQHTYTQLPIPYNEETINHVTNKILQYQEALGGHLVIENIPQYFRYNISNISEYDFLNELVNGTGCKLSMAIDSILINSKNNKDDPFAMIDGLDWKNVAQIKLGSHTIKDNLHISSAKSPIHEETWSLVKYIYKNHGAVSTLIEWDQEIPSLSDLQAEVQKAKSLGELNDI
ncbi:MAG: DUF692 domain-containing protein [Bdellovibrionales bacterium]|nr:DUF692 domain-containing protein [Bdellovibrionales bacterium]NQZ18635.1 DUF692 domain-containing protein [Bdellovibrionales bacterium]